LAEKDGVLVRGHRAPHRHCSQQYQAEQSGAGRENQAANEQRDGVRRPEPGESSLEGAAEKLSPPNPARRLAGSQDARPDSVLEREDRQRKEGFPMPDLRAAP
jgi:hypothetical protein